MKVLTHPVVIRMGIALVAAGFALVTGIVLIRLLKRRVQEEGSLGEGDPAGGAFPMHTYHAVIQQLKQQKHEIQSLQQAERRRARTSENVSAAVLSNLSSGVLFFDAVGLVRQANAAAKSILGFASPTGMSAHDLFRSAPVNGAAGGLAAISLADAVGITLEDGMALHQLESDYKTPAGEARVLEITVSPVKAANGERMGAACLIDDRTAMAQMRRKQELRGEMSSEMALELKHSLSAISGYARKLAENRDPRAAEQLAADIAAEAEHLDHTIGGFLAGAQTGAAPGV